MNRRTLLAGATAGLALGASRLALAATAPRQTLSINTRVIEVNGRAATVYGLADAAGHPGLVLDAGSDFDVLLDNRLAEQTLIHWHGLTPPVEMDGVPDQPRPMLAPGEQRSYRFPVGSGGTHWMHAHTLQEQNLLAAPLIVRTAEDRAADRQEVVVLLHDFSFTPAAELLAGLGTNSGGHGGMQGMDHGTMGGDAMGGMSSGGMAMGGMTSDGMSMGSMSMGGMDLNDIAYDAYLANDRTLDDPEVVAVEKGGRVLLRLINGASATGFSIDLGALTGQVVAVDGNAVVPLAGRIFPLSMGQRLDIEVSVPREGGAFPILALREGAPEQTGIVLATAGASISRIAPVGEGAGPVLDLALEAQLRAREPLAARPADRQLMAHLGGSMAPYAWSMMGGPFEVRRGERVEIGLMNMSMMAHPMHLHGHHFEVVAINGQGFSGARRDTVLVPPMQTVTIAFDALHPAPAWAFHCHHLYHMLTGMMQKLSYLDA